MCGCIGSLALRARGERGRRRLPVRATRTGVGARRLPLRDSHVSSSSLRCCSGCARAAGSLSADSALSAAHRGSSTSWWWSGSSARWAPHSEHSPGQSSRHTGWNGSAGTTVSTEHGLEVEQVALEHVLLGLVVVRSHLMVVGCAIGVGEQLLEAPVDLVADGVQAPHAGAGCRGAGRAGDQHALDDGLEPEFQLDRGPLRDRDDVRAEVGRCLDRALEAFHGTGSPTEVRGVEDQRRSGVQVFHGSSRRRVTRTSPRARTRPTHEITGARASPPNARVCRVRPATRGSNVRRVRSTLGGQVSARSGGSAARPGRGR